MLALQPQPECITLEQYELLPEDKRIEIFEGIIYDMASPSQIHQALSMQLSTIINNYILQKKGACSIFNAPFDVKLSDKPLTIVQPDIMIICDRNKLDGKRCNGAPDFIVEIVSPSSRKTDYSTKNTLYSDAGVREYWIVDPTRESIDVYYFESETMERYCFKDKVKVGIYEDLEIDFSEIN